MPDHLHLLVQVQADDSDARRFIRAVKQYSAFYFKQRFGCQLWQRYGFERTLRDDEATLSVARSQSSRIPFAHSWYTNPEDYPFSGSCVHSVAEILESVQFSEFRLDHGPAEAGPRTTRTESLQADPVNQRIRPV